MRRMRSWGRYYALLTLLAIAGCQQDPGPPPELIVIDTFPATGSSQNDTFLTLIDTAGTILAQDDNGFPNQATYVGFSRIEVSGGLASRNLLHQSPQAHGSQAIPTTGSACMPTILGILSLLWLVRTKTRLFLWTMQWT